MQPGAKSVIDTEIQAENEIGRQAGISDQNALDQEASAQEAELAGQRADPSGGAAPLAAGGLTPQDLAELESQIPTGGNV